MTAGLIDLLAAGLRGRGVIHFHGDGGRPLPEIWARSEQAVAWLHRHTDPDEAVGMVLSSTFDSTATLIGAWRAGRTVASLPLPARGLPPLEYQARIEALARAAGVRLLLVDHLYLPLIPELSVAVHPFEGCSAEGPSPLDEQEGTLVQFTSGTTAEPRGIVLSLDAIAANVRSVIDAIAPRADDAVCSWLPLSHDLGLVGVFLASWAASAPDIVGGGVLCLIRPEHFLARPALWLESCARFGATITAAPNFALDLAVRRVEQAAQPLDLSRLRVVMTGAEPVQAATVRRFCGAMSRFGLSDRSICPAYGLAEATVGVTMVRPDERWRAVPVEADRLADGVWAPTDADAAEGVVEVVDCGRPLAGVEVAVEGAGDVGRVTVRSPALLARYLDGSDPKRADGVLPTADLGMLDPDGGGLFVVGRVDDRLSLRGRNVFAHDLERAVSAHAAVRRGCAAAVPEDGGYVVVAEPEPQATAAELAVACAEIRVELARRFQAAPTEVVFIAPGTLPKTPSGKMERHRLRRARAAGQLDVVAARAFSAKSNA